MQVFHTAGVPPSSGRMIRPTIGWTTNSSAALRKMAAVNATTAPETRRRMIRWPIMGGWRCQRKSSADRSLEHEIRTTGSPLRLGLGDVGSQLLGTDKRTSRILRVDVPFAVRRLLALPPFALAG